VAGNKRLLRNLLEQFAIKQADAGSQIGVALRNQDYELASRIAHTVKGVAGNLGIGAIQGAAEKIEKGIRDKDPSVSGLLPEFEAALGRMAERIVRALAESAPAAPMAESPRAFDAKAVAEALARVRSLIEANDGDAAKPLEDVEKAVGSLVDKDVLAALRNALDEFDFDTALSRLDEVAGRLLAAKG
jgi:HPt (histidine-containing phosphotransfer) domain-containing protein